MNFQNFLDYIKDNKEALTILISAFIGFIALGTFIRALMEFRLQGRQKRADLYNKFDNIFDEDSIKKIVELLETDDQKMDRLPLIDRYYFLGFYEQIYLALNSKLINKEVAYYMFGKFALACWNNNSFWSGIDKNSYDWYIFRLFIEKMKRFESKRSQKDKALKVWKKIFERNNFKH